MNEKILEEYFVKIIKLILFYEHHKEKIKVDKNGCEYILFRIDVYFTEYFLAVAIDEQNLESRELIFEEKKDKRHQKKNLVANLLELIQVMQKEVMIQIMKLVKHKYLLVKLKTKKIKEKENEIKELEDEIKKFKLQLTNQSV